jgi:hypothetical protein
MGKGRLIIGRRIWKAGEDKGGGATAKEGYRKSIENRQKKANN